MSISSDFLTRVSGADSLPSIPAVALEVLRLAENSDVTLEEMASAIEKDPAMTGKILKLVNSPLFGATKKIACLSQAIGMLGLRTVKVMALSFSVVEAVKTTESRDFDIEVFWRRSLTTAVCARLIGREMHRAAAEEAFVAGLLADVGMVAAWQCAPDDYLPILQESAESSKPITEIESVRLGVTHAAMSRELLKKWGLPESLCQMIGAHHGEGLADLTGSTGLVAKAVHSAAIIAELFCHQIPADELDRVRAECLTECGIEASNLEDLLESLDEYVRETAPLLELDIGTTISYSELRSRAALRIAQISMQADDQISDAMRQERVAREEVSRLEKKAATDGLTGAWNRAAIFEFLDRELARSAREGYEVAVILADLDHFKQINDTHGHLAGDAVLREVTTRMLDSIRRYDALGRYGGEEFMIILVDCDESQALTIAERARENIANQQIETPNALVPITASLGVSVSNGAERAAPQRLIDTADKALYRAKELGRNRTELGRLADPAESAAVR